MTTAAAVEDRTAHLAESKVDHIEVFAKIGIGCLMNNTISFG